MVWSLVDKSLILQCMCFMVIVATSLATIISMSLAKNSFEGLCGPYSEASCSIQNARLSGLSKRQINYFSNNTNYRKTPSIQPSQHGFRPNINKNKLPNLNNNFTTKQPSNKLSTKKTNNYSHKTTVHHVNALPITKPKTTSSKTTRRPSPTTTTTSATPSTSLTVETGPFSVCNFILGINLLLNFFFAGFSALYHGYRAKKSASTIRVGYEMWTKAWLSVCAVCFLFTMISACMLTVGLSHFCQSIMMALENCRLSHSQCSFSQFNKWKWNDIVVKPTLFHDFIQVTELTNWLNVGFWMIQAALYVHRLFKQRKTKTGYQDPFVTDLSESFS